jgi:hypothetical protein
MPVVRRGIGSGQIGGGDPGQIGGGDPGQIGGGDPGQIGGGDPGQIGGGDPGQIGGGDPGQIGGGDPGQIGGGDPGQIGGGDPGQIGGGYALARQYSPKQVIVAGPLVVAEKVLRFRIQRQEQSNWCWAAVAVSVDRYFDQYSDLTQCEVANKVLRVEPPPQGSPPLPTSDCGCCCQCCCDPENCDHPAELEIALQQVYKWRNTLNRALTFAEVVREIDRGRPIGVGITWLSGGKNGSPSTTGHFVAIRGYRLLSSGTRQVYVADPLNASGRVDLDEFTFSYYGDGQWTETDLLTSDWA